MEKTGSVAKRAQVVIRAALKRPDLVKNRILGLFNYWPVTPLRTERFRKVPYFCVNLEKDVKRRRLMQRQARQMGLEDFRIFPGILGADLDIRQLIADGQYDDEAARRYHGRALSPPEIGIGLCHARIYQTIVNEGLDEAIIIEDDTLFEPRNIDAADWSSVPEDFDVVLLNATLTSVPPEGRIADGVYSDASYRSSSGAYLVSKKGAEKLAKGAIPLMHASDGLLGRAMPWDGDEPHAFRQQGVNFELKCFIIWPMGAENGSCCHFYPTTIPG